MEKNDMKSQSRISQQHVTWSLIALGLLISSLAQAVYEPNPMANPSRRWAVELGMSGGYDDNVHSRPANDPNKQSSSTTTLNPRFIVNIPLDQSFLGLRYNYDWIYYWERTGGEKFDQNHSVDLIASHRFTPRLQLDISDNFRRGISPALTDLVNGVPFIRQIQGNYFNNNLTASLTYNLSRLWTMSVYNSWEYWSYDNSDPATQDRNIYSPGGSLNYLLTPATTLGANFRLGIVNYRIPGPRHEKDSVSETAFLSLSHLFNPQLSGQIAAGGGLTEMGDGRNTSSPYGNAGLTYRYGPRSTVSAGVNYFLYTSDQYGYRSSETLATYLQINHSFTQKLTGLANVNFIRHEFGDPDSITLASTIAAGTPLPVQDSWRATVGATYQFTRWLLGEAYYEYSTSSSSIPNSDFNRNRFWAGLRVTY
jgi:hypothetical protein